MEHQSVLLVVTTLVELVFSKVLKSIQEVLILLTLKTLKEICSLLELLTFSPLEKERNQSSPSWQEKVLKEDLKRKEISNKRDKTDESFLGKIRPLNALDKKAQ
jgi:hypothetical protein